MNRIDVYRYILSKYMVEPDYPFVKEMASNAVYRHRDNDKWFVVSMTIPAYKIGGDRSGNVETITIKAERDYVQKMLETPGFHHGFKMNKKYWLTLELDTVPAMEIYRMIDKSFELTANKEKVRKTKKIALQ